jgi:hypothetical protein
VVESPKFLTRQDFTRIFVAPRTPEICSCLTVVQRPPFPIDFNMSSSRLVARVVNVPRAERLCASCNCRQIVTYVNAPRPSIQPIRRARWTSTINFDRAYATSASPKLEGQRLRKDVDERARLGFYALSQKQGALLMDRVKANSIAKEFLARQKTTDNHSNVKQMATSASHLVSENECLC